MISTQPGPTSLASFNVVALDEGKSHPSFASGNSIGPYGDRDESLLFVQKVVPYIDQIFVRYAATGRRLMTCKSIDGSRITSFTIHECDAATRMGSRPRRFLFTGHSNGTIQIWDISTAIDRSSKIPESAAQLGPSDHELLQLLHQCDLSASRCTTPLNASGSSLFTNLKRDLTRYAGRGHSTSSLGGCCEPMGRMMPAFGESVEVAHNELELSYQSTSSTRSNFVELVDDEQQPVNVVDSSVGND